jgi:PBSX family phage terminase large subunit
MPAKWLPIHKEIKSLLANHEELMLMGGAGSGKTHFMLNVIFKRAMLMPGSRHICFRKRFEHTKNTLWNSAKEHAELEWPGIFESITLNRSGGTWSMEINGSHILFSGLDDNERIEKHLGSEFATIYLNEVSEISNENDVELIASRLRQKIDGRHLLLLDQNPPAKSHWTYRRYVEDAGKVKGRASFKINPIDVKENLPASYIARLEALPERMRQRFLHGEFTSDIEGALWSWEMIEGTRTGLSGEDGRWRSTPRQQQTRIATRRGWWSPVKRATDGKCWRTPRSRLALTCGLRLRLVSITNMVLIVSWRKSIRAVT